MYYRNHYYKQSDIHVLCIVDCENMSSKNVCTHIIISILIKLCYYVYYSGTVI